MRVKYKPFEFTIEVQRSIIISVFLLKWISRLLYPNRIFCLILHVSCAHLRAFQVKGYFTHTLVSKVFLYICELTRMYLGSRDIIFQNIEFPLKCKVWFDIARVYLNGPGLVWINVRLFFLTYTFRMIIFEFFTFSGYPFCTIMNIVVILICMRNADRVSIL